MLRPVAGMRWPVEAAAWRPEGLEQQGGGREGMRSEIREIMEATQRSWLSFCPSQGSFREEEGCLLTGVLTGSFCKGDTAAGRGAGPAWGYPATGALRPGLSLQGRAAWESKVQPGWGRRLARVCPGGQVAGVGKALTLPCQGQWEPEMAPEAVLVWEQHLVFGEGPAVSGG